MKTYTELFTNYKQNISRLAIIKNIPSTKARRRVILIVIAVIILFVAIMWWVNPELNMVCTIAGSVICLALVKWGDVANRKDLLETFTFDYSQQEESTQVLLDILQAEILRLHLEAWDKNADYIKNLYENSQEWQKETKKEFNLKGWEGLAILTLLLSNYAHTLYAYFKTEKFSFEQISMSTALLIFTLIALSVLYFNFKSLYLLWRNTDYIYHKELYFLLKDLETKARFENNETLEFRKGFPIYSSEEN